MNDLRPHCEQVMLQQWGIISWMGSGLLAGSMMFCVYLCIQDEFAVCCLLSDSSGISSATVWCRHLHYFPPCFPTILPFNTWQAIYSISCRMEKSIMCAQLRGLLHVIDLSPQIFLETLILLCCGVFASRRRAPTSMARPPIKSLWSPRWTWLSPAVSATSLEMMSWRSMSPLVS